MTIRTPEIETAILEGFADGRSLRVLCREHGITRSAFYKWRRGDPDLARRFEEMRFDRADSLMDDSFEMAGDPSSAWVCRRADGGGEPADLSHIRHARLEIDSRLRMAHILFARYEASVARERRGPPAADDQSDIAAILEAAYALPQP